MRWRRPKCSVGLQLVLKQKERKVNFVCFDQQSCQLAIPSSGMRRVMVVLKGPWPMTVEAAITHVYVVWGDRSVSIKLVAFVLNWFTSPVTTLVCVIVYPVITPFCSSARGWFH